MEESVTYQALIARGEIKGRLEGKAEGRLEGVAQGKVEGKAEEARKIILLIGNKRLGPPTGVVQVALKEIIALDRLETLIDRVLEVENWQELLT